MERWARLVLRAAFYLLLFEYTILIMLRTWLAVGRHSRMLSMSLALPSGSLGKRTLSASRSIWYRALVNSGSGNSRR